MKLNCKQCGKEIHKAPSQVKNGEGKFCSRSCYHESMKGVDLFTNEIRGRKSRVRVQIDCAVCGKAFETVPSKIGIRKYCSDKCYQKEHSAKIKDLKYIRDTQAYKEWRISVYKRDRFTCQSCGVVGNGLNAHHITPVVVDIERIFDVNNGITLCKECHKLVHKSYKPKSKQDELLGRLMKIEKISSQAKRGRLEGSQTKAYGLDQTMKPHECPASKDDDIVGAVWQHTDVRDKKPCDNKTGRFIEETSYLSNAKGSGTTYGEALFFGADAVREGIVIPEEIRIDLPKDFGRDQGIAWLYLGGFAKTWDYSTDGETRIIHLTSA